MSEAQRRDNPRAEQAFHDYVALGPSRSLRALHASYVQQTASKPPAKSIDTLFKWSSQYGWQDRIASVVSAHSDALLQQAAELDADTFLATSRLINERVHYSHPGDTDVVIKMRESVRKPIAKGTASVDVTVNVDVQLRQMAEEIAERTGLNVDQIIADAQEYINATRVK